MKTAKNDRRASFHEFSSKHFLQYCGFRISHISLIRTPIRPIFCFEFGCFFARNPDQVFDFVNFSPKFSDLIFKLAAQEINEVCWRFLPKIEIEICFKPSFPWIRNLNLIPLIQILGGGPQDLRSWNGSDKICKIRMPEKKERTQSK